MAPSAMTTRPESAARSDGRGCGGSPDDAVGDMMPPS
jgi:hypothetical protein